MSRAINVVSFSTPWNKPADAWARDKAAEMHAQGYAPGVIIAKLEAYGIGIYAAQAIASRLHDGGTK